MAEQITASATTPYEKASAIATYLQTNYTYKYGIDDPLYNTKPPSEDPVDWFLFDHKVGTCGNFSSAFVVLARSIGLPARVVSGWAVSATAEQQVVYADQGHQWAEVAFANLGWVTFEATAGAPHQELRRPTPLPQSLRQQLPPPQPLLRLLKLQYRPQRLPRRGLPPQQHLQLPLLQPQPRQLPPQRLRLPQRYHLPQPRRPAPHRRQR